MRRSIDPSDGAHYPEWRETVSAMNVIDYPRGQTCLPNARRRLPSGATATITMAQMPVLYSAREAESTATRHYGGA